MSKWIIKHVKLLTYLFIALTALAIIILSYFKVMETIYLFIIYLAVTILFIIAINNVSVKYFKKLVAEFESTCNPEKYIELLMIYYKNSPKNVIAQLDYAAALLIMDRSKLQTARMLMETMRVDKIPEKSANIRYIYYNNLCLIYTDLDELDKAEEAYSKALNYYNQIKNATLKSNYTSKLANLAFGIAIKKNDLDASLKYLSRFKTDTLLAKVTYALALAKIYILKEENEKAKEQLSFVIENAGKISDGQEAKELLAKIS